VVAGQAPADPGDLGQVRLAAEQCPGRHRRLDRQHRAGGDPGDGAAVREQAGGQGLDIARGVGQQVDLVEAAIVGERAVELEVGDVLAERILAQPQPAGRMIDRQT